MRALLPSNLAVQALSLALATIGGAVVALLLVGGTGGRDVSDGSGARTAPMATPVVQATRSALPAVLMSSAAAESAAAPNQSVAVATPAPAPSADDEWSALQPQLDAAWQTGPDQTITLLEAFLLSAPDYPAGREKLYAALVARGQDLFSQGDVSAATSQLERAQQLFPDRAEASDLLSAMTPEPAAEPAPPDADPAAQGDVPADANPPTPGDVAAADATPPTQVDVAADANPPTQVDVAADANPPTQVDVAADANPPTQVDVAAPEANTPTQVDVAADANPPTQVDVAAPEANTPTLDVAAPEANPPTQVDVAAADANTPTQDDPPVADDPPPITHAAVVLAPVAPPRVQQAAPPRVQPATVPPVRQPAPPAPLPTPTKVPFVPT
jgi:hypothetical protein